jgi:hypothetical protein
MACDWLLIDGSSLIFRAYYGALARARVSGTDENVVGGFLDRLARLIADRRLLIVPPVGLEPTTFGLKVRCSTS